MRILITGFVVFVIWCFISAWLYNVKVLPALNKPVPVQTIPEEQTNVADSLAQIVADSLAQIEVTMPKTLMVYFEFDKSEFKNDPPIDNSITEIKGWIEKYESSILLVTGHTDYVGTSDYNQDLGSRRALSIQKVLEAKGIPLTRINTDSKGEDQPVGDNQTREGRAMNRRTEISIKMQ